MGNEKCMTARLAVQFGRQGASYAMTVDEIAGDAMKFARLAQKARRAVARQSCAEKVIAQARTISDRYNAELVALNDPEGCVVALKFRSGLYSSGFRNLFFVA